MGTSQHDMTSTLNTFGIIQDETVSVEMSPHQFSTCQEANGQFL